MKTVVAGLYFEVHDWGIQAPNDQNTLIVKPVTLEENQKIHFHYHCQAHLIRYLDAIISAHDLMQNPGHASQNHLTQTKNDPVDPDDLTQFQPWSV